MKAPYLNRNAHCLSQDDCRATDTGLWRMCAKACGRYSAARKRPWADPAVRAKMEKSLGWFSPAELAEVIEEIQAGERRYIDIAEDWLVTEATISKIACNHGIYRRPRKPWGPSVDYVGKANARFGWDSTSWEFADE